MFRLVAPRATTGKHARSLQPHGALTETNCQCAEIKAACNTSQNSSPRGPAPSEQNAARNNLDVRRRREIQTPRCREHVQYSFTPESARSESCELLKALATNPKAQTVQLGSLESPSQEVRTMSHSPGGHSYGRNHGLGEQQPKPTFTFDGFASPWDVLRSGTDR